MRRLVYSGLVPCEPRELAGRFLDPQAAPDIWPALGRRTVLRSGANWFEAATPELGGEPGRPAVRFRRTRPTEVLAASTGRGAWAHHRFLPAQGGCLWVIENVEERRHGESWTHFARRRHRSQQAIEDLVDGAAAHFAASAR